MVDECPKVVLIFVRLDIQSFFLHVPDAIKSCELNKSNKLSNRIQDIRNIRKYIIEAATYIYFVL